ncbi:MAG: hypothetical protein M3Z10_02460, partial [Gemmatimonadota bacterium]|nr:hypothetical protein [Gemmatimonadota bacterium]
LVIRLALQFIVNGVPRASSMFPAVIVALILSDIVNTVSLVVALNTSPRAERRAFRLAAWVWESRFAAGFFRLAAVGQRRPKARPSATSHDVREMRLADLMPATVVSRFPELPALLRQLEESQSKMRVREFEIARALAEAGDGRSAPRQPGQSWAGPRATTVADAPLGENALEHRRSMLLAQMRESAEWTRTRRATVAAALANARIQLLRIGGGFGDPDDMREEVATLSAFVAREADVGPTSVSGAVRITT